MCSVLRVLFPGGLTRGRGRKTGIAKWQWAQLQREQKYAVICGSGTVKKNLETYIYLSF